MGTKKPRHILWDWNGTLQDDVQAAVNGINLLLRERNMPEVTVETHRKHFSIPVRTYYEALGFALEKEDWDEMARRFSAAFTSDPCIGLFPGARETLRMLREAQVGMSIITAAPQKNIEEMLDVYGIRSYFTAVSGAADPSADSKVARGKRLFEALGISPSEAYMIGDTTHDKEVADAIGCPCILLSCGYESVERLEKNACPVLSSVAAIPAFLGV